MKTQTVQIVHIGRGPQIEGHRLTVMDVFYYLHRGRDFDFIHRAMPSLTREEFNAVVEYVKDHHAELVETDRRVEERIKQGIAEQKARGLYREMTHRFLWRNGLPGSRKRCANKRPSTRRKTVVTLLVDANLDGHAALIEMRLGTAWIEAQRTTSRGHCAKKTAIACGLPTETSKPKTRWRQRSGAKARPRAFPYLRWRMPTHLSKRGLSR